MSNYNSLKATINANIKQNGNQEITGPVLNSVLTSIVNSLGAGYQYIGVADSSTNPGTPDQNVVYLAGPGPYPHFGGLVVPERYLGVLKYNGTWAMDLVEGVGSGAAILRYVAVASIADLPDPGMQGVGYLVGENLYLYVGEGGDTLDGKYQDCGAFRGPQGAPTEGNGEDIDTDSHGKMQFANRPYNTLTPNGLGYKILRKDATFASQVTAANTIYEIRYDFDLNGGSVTIPAGCTLRFNGGAISNGTIVYDNTEIQGEPIISCTCTGGLRNSVATPQMYGAKGDGVTDDVGAINNAVTFNDSVFFPAGTYIISNRIYLKDNSTIYGVGQESKIHNIVVQGYEKFVFAFGEVKVGTSAGSFLELPTQGCTIGNDRKSVVVEDSSAFAVGDIVYICLSGTWTTTKNPTYSWNAIVTEIGENNTLYLDSFVAVDELIGQSCVIRNMANLPSDQGIVRNVCIHDLECANIVDSGSGMYVFGFAAYNLSIYNIWAHGNTIFGSNYAVNVTIENVNATFDGGYLDIPEISQYVVFRNNRGKRTGERLNVIGMSFLAGYGVLVEGNEVDFGNAGKVGFLHHIRPIIRNNTLLNLMSANNAVELSFVGRCVFENNFVSSKQNSPILAAIPVSTSLYNIIKGNYFDVSVKRWLTSYTDINWSKNLIKDNYSQVYNLDDAAFLDLPDLSISMKQGRTIAGGTINVAAGNTYTCMGKPYLGTPRIFYGCILASGGYTLTIKSLKPNGTSGVKITKTISNAGKTEMFKIGGSNYMDFLIDGVPSRSTNNAVTISEITITNNGSSSIQIYEAFFVPIVP